jgi:hypothetical protein
MIRDLGDAASNVKRLSAWERRGPAAWPPHSPDLTFRTFPFRLHVCYRLGVKPKSEYTK